MYEYYDEEAIELLRSGINPVTFPDLRISVTSDESKAINDDPVPKIIISASGMCEAGRIRHHLKHNLWRPECTILFVGYQSAGTLGAKLLAGDDSVKLFGEDIAVKAEILRIDSFSSHADEPHLRAWVRKVKPGIRIFINHGEDKIAENFAEEAAMTTGKPAVAPYSGEVWDLAADELVHRAEVIPIIKKKTYTDSNGDHRSSSNYSPAYRDLRKSADELMRLINRSQEHSNKELNRMRREIEEILNKYGN